MATKKAPYGRIIGRGAWGARPPRSKVTQPNIVKTTVHHTAGPPPSRNTRAAEEAKMREIQNFHMDGNGWDDIAYGLLIMPSGRVYRGRGIGVIGAHVGHNNTGNAGICLVGNFETAQPTKAALASLRHLVKNHPRLRGKPVYGHRDFGGTACPGKNLYPITKEL
jgi:hypothetical protein